MWGNIVDSHLHSLFIKIKEIKQWLNQNTNVLFLKITVGIAGSRLCINPPTIKEAVKELKEVHDLGVEIAIVVGGGTFGKLQKKGINAPNRLYGNVTTVTEAAHEKRTKTRCA